MIRFEYQTESGLLKIECNVMRSTPARLTGHPDDQHPAEGGEVEDVQVYRAKLNQWGKTYWALVPATDYAALGIDVADIEERALEIAAEVPQDNGVKEGE